MQKRLFYLDVMKGILIILVILGHSIQDTISDYQNNFLFRFIYSFHMPLFFAISDYLTFKNKYDKTLLKKRALQLLVPFGVWAFALPICTYGILDWNKTQKILLYPDNGLWFLYNLFIYSTIFNATERWKTKRFGQTFLFCICYIILCILMTIFHKLFNFTQICWYLPFFAIGFYLHKYERSIQKYNKAILWTGTILYMCTIPFWMMREEPLFYKWINLGNVFSYFYRYAVEFIGTILFFTAGKKLLNHHFIGLNQIGRQTLGIYAFQFITLYHISKLITLQNVYVNIFLKTIFTLITSYIIVLIIERIKFINLLFIGKAK